MATRRSLLEKHNNDYGFDVLDVLSTTHPDDKSPKVSVVIPYYNTGVIFEHCLYFLSRAIKSYAGEVEIIVIDDGSKLRPLVDHIKNNSIAVIHLQTIISKQNQGRTEARNLGLNKVTGEIVLFLDSDVLVDEILITNHIKLHNAAVRNGQKAICVSFFEFTNMKNIKVMYNALKPDDLKINDFRIECTYGPTWIGCEDDKQYIDQHMRLLDETNDLKSWKGKYKAWVLPNMILGGAFSVIRSEIVSVGSFDKRFKGYGFDETSAITRMIAERSNVVIPCKLGGALHIEDKDINISITDKDRIFKLKHDFYFEKFLMEEAK